MVRYQHPFPKAANYDASDPYGMEPPPPFRNGAPHRGADYNGPAAQNLAPVPAIAEGVVDWSAWYEGLGNVVTIKHADGAYSGYCHLTDRNVSVGQTIARGAIVGRVGGTATSDFSYAPHLHLTMGWSSAATRGSGSYWSDHFDPIPYIDQRLNAPETGDDMAKSYPTRDDYRGDFTLAINQATQLKNANGTDANIAATPDVGRLFVTGHVYAQAAAGQALDIWFILSDVSTGAESPHFVERAVAGPDGRIFANPTFQLGLASTRRVFLRIQAPSSNTATVKITRLAADATLFQ
ncbi:M23 family metallopeptidase [Agromyces soli]|uniref:M23 family metallopeptidase n=1 Tax=Agromyces soli TaxID=659012 RepID=A0ABY4B168_9MICO|nr:M23 family metallopeptidase [Agromyces soli]UOE27813.1 M23 family metallopeptidase [Agromyces soli]